MSEKDNGSFKLSRRKALASMGAIGAAGALGIGGTWAQFTDTEEEVVSFTAGGIDGTVVGKSSYNGTDLSTFDPANEDFESEDSVQNVGFGDSGALGLGISLTDVKPGDYGCFAFKITVENNPAWVAACLGYTNNYDNDIYEPEVENETDLATGTVPAEADIGAQDDTQTEGEMPQHLLTIPFYKGNSAPSTDQFDPCVFFDVENEEYDASAYQGSGAVGTSTAFWDNATGTLYPQTLEDAVTFQNVDTMTWGQGGEGVETLNADSIAVGPGCVFLNGAIDSNENQQEAAPLEPGDEIWMGWDWHLPFDTPNAVQGDKIDLQLGFVFGQTRHTESAELSNIYAPSENTPNGG